MSKQNGFKGIFDVFGKKKPITPVFMLRVPTFDPIARVNDKDNTHFIHRFKYGKKYVTIRRPELSIVEQKIFFTLLKTGKFIKETEDGYVFHYDFARFKEISGINPATKWKDVKKSLERLSKMSILIENKNPDGEYTKYLSMSCVIYNYKIVKKDHSITFEVGFSKDFIKLLKTLLLFSVPLQQLKDMNQIKNPIIYRLVSFFITQTKKLSWELFDLLKCLTPIEFNTKDKRHRVLKAIQENKKILKKYGITATETKKEKAKTFILNFKRPKHLYIQLEKHVNVENKK